ncbi:MAG: hypothetical protein QOG60_1006 [Frankiaceae bacterium]|nr:hypothetical protein [Frankiaceae bacterium]
MVRHLLQRHANAPAHLIEVAVKWPTGLRPQDGSVRTAPSRARFAEALAAYRRHSQRLAEALCPEPIGTSDRSWASRLSTRSATSDRGGRSLRLLPTAPVSRDMEPSGLFDPDLLEAATALYDPALPYHNACHALRAVANGERLLRACSQAGVRVDATVVRLALLFHDAGYGTDPSTAGCPDAESYAGSLARRALADRVPPTVLDDIESAILATRRGTLPETPEAKVVRAADLADLGADYDTFAAHSEALRVEHEQLSGARVSLADWRKSVDQLLSDYLQERLWPLELLDDGCPQARFHATAKANLSRYLGQLT